MHNRKLVLALCDKIWDAKLEKIPKVCKSRTDEVDKELLRKLKDAGFMMITFGVESFDDEVLA